MELPIVILFSRRKLFGWLEIDFYGFDILMEYNFYS